MEMFTTKSIITIGNMRGFWRCMFILRITSLILMRFAETLCKSFILGEKLYGYAPEYLLKSHTVYIVPMLNPDGFGFFLDKQKK